MMDWRPMKSAPKDGREILARRHNDICHEFCLVWWDPDSDKIYPWRSDHTAYPEGRLDEWTDIGDTAPVISWD